MRLQFLLALILLTDSFALEGTETTPSVDNKIIIDAAPTSKVLRREPPTERKLKSEKTLMQEAEDAEGFYQMKFMLKSMKQKQELDQISFLMSDIQTRAQNIKNNLDLKLNELIELQEARSKVANSEINLYKVQA